MGYNTGGIMNKSVIANIVGGLAIVFAIMFPEPANITTWSLFFGSIIDFISNPYLLMLSAVGLYGYLTNLEIKRKKSVGDKDE